MTGGQDRLPALPLRVGVLGTGRIGRLHARLLAGQVAGATLAGLHDVEPAVARPLAVTLGVPSMGAEEMLSSSQVDAVAICTPTPTHVDFIIKAAAARKHIFCEKPVSLELAEVDRATAAVQSGVALMVGFNRRYDASHAAVREAVRNGSLGQPHLVRVTSRDPSPPPMSYALESGGIFLDMTVHDFDMARFLVGSDITCVHAAGAVLVQPELSAMGDVDTAVVTLWHENGCLGLIDNSRQAAYGYDQRVEVLGSKGAASSDNPSVNTAVFRDRQGAHFAGIPSFFLERYREAYLRQWDAFVASVASGSPPPVGGAEARAALVAGLAARLSLAESRPVHTAEVDIDSPGPVRPRAVSGA